MVVDGDSDNDSDDRPEMLQKQVAAKVATNVTPTKNKPADTVTAAIALRAGAVTSSETEGLVTGGR
jgi:hypothetical protein